MRWAVAMIRFECPKCGTPLIVEQHAIGKLAKCHKCSATVRVPDIPVDAEVVPNPVVVKRERARAKFGWYHAAIATGCFAVLGGALIVALNWNSWEKAEQQAAVYVPNDSESPEVEQPPVEVEPEPETPLAEDTTPHFRNVRWGMSREEVERIESKGVPLMSDRDFTAYITSVSSIQVTLSYFFYRDTLVSAKYMVIGNYEDDRQFVRDFITLASLVTIAHGDPASNDAAWVFRTYEDGNVVLLSKMLRDGDLSAKLTWEAPHHFITIAMWHNGTAPTVQVAYRSRAHDYEAKLLEARQAIEDL